MSETVEIVVNGRTVQARRDKPLIHACLQAEEEVPHYCYHPDSLTREKIRTEERTTERCSAPEFDKPIKAEMSKGFWKGPDEQYSL